MRQVALGLLAILLVASSCSSDSEKPSSAASTEPSRSVGTDSDAVHVDGKAKATLRDAVAETASSDVIAFKHEMDLAGEAIISTEGAQAMSGRWSARTVTNDPSTSSADPQLDMETRSVGKRLWMQMAGWPHPMAGCWLELAPGEVPVGVNGLQPQLVGYVSILAMTRARQFADGARSQINVDIALRAAQLLFSGPVMEAIDLPRSKWTSTRVTGIVEIRGGRVESIHVDGSDVVDAVEHDGGTISDAGRRALALTDTTVTYKESDGSAIASPPPPELTVTEREARQGCR